MATIMPGIPPRFPPTNMTMATAMGCSWMPSAKRRGAITMMSRSVTTPHDHEANDELDVILLDDAHDGSGHQPDDAARIGDEVADTSQ